jgi:ADP-ribose pyrophosphatase
VTWTKNSSRLLYESQWYNVRQDELTLPSGEDITYTIVDHPGYAVVVPVLADGRIVMEQVYRHSIEATLLECPSGGLDGQDPAVAAIRELEEETGYVASQVEALGTFYGSSGISNERFHLFLARDVQPGGETALEATEEIEVVLFELDVLVSMAECAELADGPSALAVLLAARRLNTG